MADQWERKVAKVYSVRNAELAAENERLRKALMVAQAEMVAVCDFMQHSPTVAENALRKAAREARVAFDEDR